MSYGCHNRPPFAAAQVLHGFRSDNGHYIRVEIPNRMNHDCQFTKTDLGRVDPGCTDCKHKEPQ